MYLRLKITSFEQMFLIKGKWPGMMLQNGWPELCKEYFKLCFLGLGEVPAGILTKPLGQQEGMSGSESDWDCGDAGSSVPVTPGLSLRPGISSRFWGEIFTIDLGEFSLLAVQGDAEGWGQQGQVWVLPWGHSNPCSSRLDMSSWKGGRGPGAAGDSGWT